MISDKIDSELAADIKNCTEKDRILALIQLRELQISLGRGGLVVVQYADKLREIGRMAAAERLLINVADLPADKLWYRSICLGRLYEDRGDFVSAEKWYRLASEQQPDSTASWIYLGTIMSKMERYEDALKIFEIAFTKEGDTDESHLNAGNCLRALSDYEGAAKQYEIALQMSPNYAPAKLALEDIRETLNIRNRYAFILEKSKMLDS